MTSFWDVGSWIHRNGRMRFGAGCVSSKERGVKSKSGV